MSSTGALHSDHERAVSSRFQSPAGTNPALPIPTARGAVLGSKSASSISMSLSVSRTYLSAWVGKRTLKAPSNMLAHRSETTRRVRPRTDLLRPDIWNKSPKKRVSLPSHCCRKCDQARLYVLGSSTGRRRRRWRLSSRWSHSHWVLEWC